MNDLGQPIPVVCFEASGDEWAESAYLSDNLSEGTYQEYKSFLLEPSPITTITGDDVYGKLVREFVHEDLFLQAMEFGGVTPDTPAEDRSSIGHLMKFRKR